MTDLSEKSDLAQMLSKYSLSDRGWAYLQLMRPANIVTAWADILAGFAASVGIIAPFTLEPLGWLLLATTGLYGGGIVFNDLFDADLDAKERPERPIPSGRASRQGAALLGSLLLSVGVLAAAQVSQLSALIAAGIAVSALLYDALSKHHPVIGPLNIGCCRGGNLLLGMSAVPTVVGLQGSLALIPVVYVAAVTAVSQGEVQGGQRRTGVIALLLLGVVLGGLLTLDQAFPGYSVLSTLAFWALLVERVVPPFIRAMLNPDPGLIRKAVKAGVLSLVVLNATVAAGFAGWLSGLLVLSLLPLSLVLAKRFAVT